MLELSQPLFFEALGIGVGDHAEGLVTKGERGVAEEGLVGAGDEPTGHGEDRIGTAAADA